MGGIKVYRSQLSGAQSDNSLGRSLSPPSYYPQCISLRQRGESQRLTVLFVVPSDSTNEMVSSIPSANFSLSLFHPSHPLLFSSFSIAEKLSCFYFSLLASSIMPFSCFTHFSVPSHLFWTIGFNVQARRKEEATLAFVQARLDLLQYSDATDNYRFLFDGGEAKAGVLIGLKCISRMEVELLHSSKWQMNRICQVYEIKDDTQGNVSSLFYSPACILRKLFDLPSKAGSSPWFSSKKALKCDVQ